MRNRDAFRGCLIGGAAGDALGYAVEFSSKGSIFSKYGPHGITEYELDRGTARISDDTQMTLFTAAGLLLGKVRGGEGQYAKAVNAAYMDWLETQEGFWPAEGAVSCPALMAVPGLYSRRAPGGTCLNALRAGGRGTPELPINNSKGCGGVMRVAPIGLYFNDAGCDVRTVARLGAEAAALTHGHPLGWMPAAALAQIIHEVSQDGASLTEATAHALRTVEEMWPDTEHRRYFTQLIERAVELADGDTDDLAAIETLGEGWVGEEALAIAVFCALRYEDDIDRALIASVNHSGDSDSTGAVTGNILGAMVGYSGMPRKYTEKLELRELLLETADALYEDRPICAEALR